ncbi:MAG: hypothetical protein ACTJGH_00465 [Peptoniphilaceae bacterium]
MKLFYNEENIVTLIYYVELPDELKDKNYLELEELPAVEERSGFNSVLKCDGTNVWYDYEPRELTEEELLGQEVSKLKINDLIKDKTIDSLGQEVAKLKIQVLLKGGDM